MSVLDVSSPSSPILLDNIIVEDDESIVDVIIRNGRTYTLNYKNNDEQPPTTWLTVYDYSNPSNLIELGSKSCRLATALDVSDDYMFVVESYGQYTAKCFSYDVYDPAYIFEMDNFEFTPSDYSVAYDMIIKGDYAYVRVNDRIWIVDISNPYVMNIVDDHIGRVYADMAIQDNYLFAGGDDLYIYEINGNELDYFSHITINDRCRDLSVSGRYALYASERGIYFIQLW